MFLATLIASQLLFAAAEISVQSPQDSDKEDNAVEAKVYLYSVDKWDTEGTDTLATAMANNANKHCNKSYQDCCLMQNWTTSSTRFSASDYTDDFDGYPIFKRPYLTVKVALNIPSGLSSYIDPSCTNQTYIKKATVLNLMEASRDSFSDKTEHYIVEIEEKSFSVPPNKLVNYIMIPISVAIVIVLIILLIILMWKCGGPPEPAHKLEMTATNSVTTTMTPTAVEVQVEPSANPSSVKTEQQESEQQSKLENGNTKDKAEENKNLMEDTDSKNNEPNSQHNSAYDPAPTEGDGSLDDIEKELANIN